MLTTLINEYIGNYRTSIKMYCLSFKSESCLEKAISRAAMSVQENGKRHSHQRRIPKKCLEEARALLLGNKAILFRADSFEELFEYVRLKIQSIHGIGGLTIYDIALRIGAYLEVYPNRVYLHRGSLEGVKALGVVRPKRCISLKELPGELSILEPYEIEDFLCIYKSCLSEKSENPNPSICQKQIKPSRPCL
jgi:hypothetical protein